MQRYEKYKDSGIDWLGEIPEHWEVKKVKNIGGLKSGEAITNSQLLDLGKYKVYGGNGFIGYYEKYNVNGPIIVIGRVGAFCGNVRLIEEKAWVSDNALILSLSKTFLYSFYVKVLDVADLNKLNTSNAQPLITGNKVLNFEIPLPPLLEQKAIVEFLDDKCEKINTAVNLKEQQIEKLKELRQITIHIAVTKGVSHSRGEAVKMKDSGIDWIGEIPEGWTIKKLKSFIKNLEGGVSVNASETENASSDEIGVLKTSAVYKYSFEPTENKKVFESEIKRVSCPVKKGAIIISRMNAPELVGASGIVLEDYPNLYLPDRLWQTVYNENIEFDNHWLSKVLISRNFRSFMGIFANGSSPSMKNISKGDFLNIFIPIPPITEQKEIVTYLEEQIAKIDKAIAQKQEQIAKLKEYKQSLINEVVTGKIKVIA